MAATLQTLRDLQDQILANSKTGNFEEDERVQALNDARLEVMEYARWPQFRISSTVSFTSGTGSLPTNFFYDEEDLYEANTDGTRKTVYQKVSPVDFVENSSKTYTILDSAGTAVLKIFEADTVSLTFWYTKKPWSADMSAAADTTGFAAEFDRVMALLSVAYLIGHKNPDNPKARLLKYGASGNPAKPEDGSAYKILSKLFAQYKRRYSPRKRTISSFYASNSFY